VASVRTLAEERRRPRDTPRRVRGARIDGRSYKRRTDPPLAAAAAAIMWSPRRARPRSSRRVRREPARTLGGRKLCGPPAALSPREGLRSSRLPARSLDDERSLAPQERTDPAAVAAARRADPDAADRRRRRDAPPDAERRHGQAKNGFVWTFVAPDEHGDHDVAYVFAGSRSGETPKRILGGTKGTLIVDAYSGYNVVAEVSKRNAQPATRTFGATSTRHSTAPIAQEAIDLILGLYRVEHDAKAQEITGTKPHLRLRRQRAGAIRDDLHAWLLRQKSRHPPKSPIATAIRYALNQWRELGHFLDAARVPLDNNVRALAPTRRGRSQELSLRRRRRGRREHRWALHTRRDVRGARDQPIRLPVRRHPARTGSPEAPARRATARSVDPRSLRGITLRR
jgi:hypothetical protein